MPGGSRALYRAKEEERDQSYFLFGTTHAQLDLLRFPLGDLRQGADPRAGARSFGLAVADKHDSQDICFVPTGRYTDVIERLKPGAAAAGDVVDMDGKVLGRHDGIIHFTIGQRRGLKIAGPAPLYVVALDAANAARRGRPARGADDAAHRAARRQLDRRGRARSRARRRTDRGVRQGALDAAAAARRSCRPRPAAIEIELVDGEDGVSPGQACVFYDSAEGQARVLGGGFIRAAAATAQGRHRSRAGSRDGGWRSTATRSRRPTPLGAGL